MSPSRHQDERLPSDGLEALTARLAEALATAHRVGLGLPPDVQPLVRAFARAHRAAGTDISAALVHVKALVREHSGTDTLVFAPKVVGWTVAGFYSGTSPNPR